VSQFVTISLVRAVVGEARRQQVMDIVRGVTFIGGLLLAWISLKPFPDLGDMRVGDISSGSDVLTYAAFGGMAVLTLALTMRENMRGLISLLTPAFVLFGAWLCISIVMSFDPDTSIRRFAVTSFVFAVAAAMMLLPKSQDELMRWFSIGALVLLVTCFLGVLLAPNLSIHLATDAQEPALAGNWRGTFGHKNMAAAVMVMLLFIGIYTCRLGAWISGVAIIGLASLFLFFSAGKSSLTLCFAVIVLTSLTGMIRSLWARAIMLLTPLLLLNMLGVGTVLNENLAEIAQKLPLDTTFTGRSDIWTFAVQSLQERLAFGYGFAAFWGSSAIQNLPEGKEWAAYASHSHNGYLDTALAMGLPGLALLIVAIVIAPLWNFQAADEGGNNGPLAMLLLRLWLFGLYLSSMESFFLDRADPLWFTFLLAVFGLHYLARFRLRDEA
jgi:O-antigen ligase